MGKKVHVFRYEAKIPVQVDIGVMCDSESKAYSVVTNYVLPRNDVWDELKYQMDTNDYINEELTLQYVSDKPEEVEDDVMFFVDENGYSITSEDAR